jgi:hypothetical protein
MKALWLSLLILTGCQTPSINHESAAKASAALLGFTDGTCSGTLVGPDKLLSASHCFQGGRLLTVNQVPVNVIQYQHDGKDHALLTLDATFPSHAPVNFGGMGQGERVFLYGNPSGLVDMLRRGYVAGTVAQGTLLDIAISQGDSGAAVFNDQGQVVGVITGYTQLQSGMRLAIVHPFTSDFNGWPIQIED